MHGVTVILQNNKPPGDRTGRLLCATENVIINGHLYELCAILRALNRFSGIIYRTLAFDKYYDSFIHNLITLAVSSAEVAASFFLDPAHWRLPLVRQVLKL